MVLSVPLQVCKWSWSRYYVRWPHCCKSDCSCCSPLSSSPSSVSSSTQALFIRPVITTAARSRTSARSRHLGEFLVYSKFCKKALVSRSKYKLGELESLLYIFAKINVSFKKCQVERSESRTSYSALPNQIPVRFMPRSSKPFVFSMLVNWSRRWGQKY